MSFFSSVRGNLGATGRGIRLLRVPTWVTSAGSLGTIFDRQRASTDFTVSATVDGGETISYSVVSGSLPAGKSLNSSTGAITGTADARASDITATFTIRATASSGGIADREFSILHKAPVVTSFNATGASSFSVPTGLTSVEVLVVAGGGAGGYSNFAFENGGGGGAGGLIYNPNLPVTPGGTVPLSVGTGGPVAALPGTYSPGNENTDAGKGGNSTFGPITATGGGNGGGQYFYGRPGGSGGGGCGNLGFPLFGGGTPGQGNPGGGSNGTGAVTNAGGGGGGAGNAGSVASNGTGGPGGNGLTYNISGSPVAYAGGGGGSAGISPGSPGASGGSGGGGNGVPGGPHSLNAADISGTANRGGGGGGSNRGTGIPGGGIPPSPVAQTGGNGGSGVVIVRF
jgi:hypothetical protein